jgi:hypothetical protein
VSKRADALQTCCRNQTSLLVEVWEERASAAAAPPLLNNRVFCPVISLKVGALALRGTVALSV